MAWTDTCKVQFQQIVSIKVMQGNTVKKILEQNAEETGIPYETLKRWYYDKGEKSLKNETHDSSPGSDKESEGNQKIKQGGKREGAGRKPQVKSNPIEKILDKMNDLLVELEGRDISGIDASRLTQFVVRVQQLLKSKAKQK